MCIRDRIEAAKLYLAIEQARFTDRLSVDFDISPATANALVPSFLLQPLIENAIKHAIAQSESGGKIRILARTAKADLLLSVEDSGVVRVGLDAPRQESPPGAGVGLKNVRERITALYGDQGDMQLGSSDLGGFRVELRFPLLTSQQGAGSD